MSLNDALFGRLQFQHLSVDHPGIDAQHKAIFDLGTRVYEEWRGGGTEVLSPAVDKLASLLAAHFAYEERLLAEIGYEDLKRHAAEHRGMLDELESIRTRIHAADKGAPSPGGALSTPGWPVMQFILEFTIGHDMNSDMGYRQALIDSRDVVQGTA